MKKLFEARKVGKRKIRRPGKTWEEEVRKAEEARGMNWIEMKGLTMERREWRKRWKEPPYRPP